MYKEHELDYHFQYFVIKTGVTIDTTCVQESEDHRLLVAQPDSNTRPEVDHVEHCPEEILYGG